MISDTIENAELYFGISKNIKHGLEWLKSTDLDNIIPDKYSINSNGLYANVQEYVTKDDANYEAHRKYVDIQYVVYGTEKVGVCSIGKCYTVKDYDAENDIEFLKSNEPDSWQILNQGEFLILFPEDAHKPSIKFNDNSDVKKVVVKVPIN